MAHLKFSVLFLLTSAILSSHHTTNGLIEPALLKSLATLDKLDVLVHFSGENSPVIKDIQRRTFQTKLAKVEALCSDLRQLADVTQSPVLNFVQGFGVQGRSFWSSNQMVIRNATLSLLQGVDAFPQVSRIQKLPIIHLAPIATSGKPKVLGRADTIQWGVEQIQADKVWSTFKTRGKNVVVANIDTGVKGTHEALQGNWRSDHGWFDAYKKWDTPNDGHGQGTHTMGIICGQGGIGVAPEAKWIACRGCEGRSCDAEQLLACGQWMLSPTNPDGTDPDPTKIPDVVSNAWGSGGGNDWYNPTIESWSAAGILHAFAIGDGGPSCKSGRSPGDQRSTFSVGSTNNLDYVSSTSSRGPAGDNPSYIKPDIVAPGVNIYSAGVSRDNSYLTTSGTAMATAHAAGTFALMLAAYRDKKNDNSARLSQAVMVNFAEKTTDSQGLSVSLLNFPCGPLISPGLNEFPNNQYGYGRINAFKAVDATINGLPRTTTSNTR